ncbi:MAG: MerR family transcriptional regulator [Desulfuromonadaceae bacterium]|nr:MerR family transcriptional regulator [Desulfuromonadaceae bacterium]MDD2854225.1 MerR family transcriptional regulator [Desulfuromonadaceae bacterium]
MVLIPAEKIYFKIGEVAEAVGVRTSVLRFWETEFSFLKPVKSGSGQRLYSKNEIDLLLQVKQLLYDEKYTIEGVKKKLSSKVRRAGNDSTDCSSSPYDDKTSLLKTVRSELILLRESL